MRGRGHTIPYPLVYKSHHMVRVVHISCVNDDDDDDIQNFRCFITSRIKEQGPLTLCCKPSRKSMSCFGLKPILVYIVDEHLR